MFRSFLLCLFLLVCVAPLSHAQEEEGNKQCGILFCVELPSGWTVTKGSNLDIDFDLYFLEAPDGSGDTSIGIYEGNAANLPPLEESRVSVCDQRVEVIRAGERKVGLQSGRRYNFLYYTSVGGFPTSVHIFSNDYDVTDMDALERHGISLFIGGRQIRSTRC